MITAQTIQQIGHCGHLGVKLELIVNELLNELNYPIEYQPTIYTDLYIPLKPDFIMNGRILEVKLSYKSGKTSTEVLKYAEHSKGLVTIIYLFGKKENRVAGTKNRHIKTHISFIVNKLPIERQTYYYDMLSKIEEEYNMFKKELGW